MRSQTAKDKFTLSYSLWMALPVLLFVVSHDLDRIFNLWLLLVPVIAGPAIIAAIFWLVGLVRNAVLRRWRRVASIVAAPIIACSFSIVLGKLGIDPDRVGLNMGARIILRRSRKSPGSETSRA